MYIGSLPIPLATLKGISLNDIAEKKDVKITSDK